GEAGVFPGGFAFALPASWAGPVALELRSTGDAPRALRPRAMDAADAMDLEPYAVAASATSSASPLTTGLLARSVRPAARRPPVRHRSAGAGAVLGRARPAVPGAVRVHRGGAAGALGGQWPPLPGAGAAHVRVLAQPGRGRAGDAAVCRLAADAAPVRRDGSRAGALEGAGGRGLAGAGGPGGPVPVERAAAGADAGAGAGRAVRPGAGAGAGVAGRRRAAAHADGAAAGRAGGAGAGGRDPARTVRARAPGGGRAGALRLPAGDRGGGGDPGG